ncbi:uncharacterized protein [Hoplias malabaricus]|uniref:uncharacterized protein n=1 Tax=Hoplias malabaricus TaxID=27720 RepID=UPI003462913B
MTAPNDPVIVSACEATSDGYITFGCVTRGFFPAESLRFSWTDGTGAAVSDMVQYPAMKQNSVNTAVSHVRVKNTGWNGKSLTCKAGHPGGDKRTTIQGPSPPTVRMVQLDQSVLCVIEGFSPEKLNILWKEGSSVVSGENWKTTKSRSGSFKAISVFNPDQKVLLKDTKYTCEVTHYRNPYKKELKSRGKFTVKVKPPVVKELFVNNVAKLECVVTGNKLDVEGAEISWTVGWTKADKSKFTISSAEQKDEVFTRSSLLTIDGSVWFKGSEVKCSTEQDKFSDKIQMKSGDKGCSVQVFKPDEPVQDKVSLLCEVSCSRLGDVYIMWQKNKGAMEEGVMVPHQGSGNPTSVLSLLTVTKDEYNKNTRYTCVVKHANMENPSTPKTASTSKSKFTVKVKPPVVRELIVNNVTKLECVVTGNKLDVEGAEISWTVGGNKADKSKFTISSAEQKDEVFTRSSLLTIDGSVWFKGSEVKCSTEQDKFSDKIQMKSGDKGCSVQVFKPDEPVQDKVSLLCEVSCSRLGDVYIMWQKNKGAMEEGVMVPHQGSGNPTSVLSLLTVTKDEYNKNTRYTCVVKHANMENPSTPKTASTSKSKFTVKVKPPVVRELIVNNVTKLECVVTGNKLDVEGAEISWTVGGNKADKSKFTISSAEQKDEVFTRSSLLTIDGSVWFKGSEVKCSTEQDKFSDKIQMKSGDKGCSVQVFKPDEPVQDKVSLLCEVSCSRLGDVYIMWQKNKGAMEEGVMVPHQGSGNPTSVLSLLTVTKDEYNKNTLYTCVVKHANMENPSTPKTASTSKSKFTVKVKPPVVKELFVNNVAKLECVVTGNKLDVEGAEISWTVGGNKADKSKFTISSAEQKDEVFTRSSLLTIDGSVWFKGSEVKCSTEQDKFSDKIQMKSGDKSCSVQINEPREPVTKKVSLLCEVSCSRLGEVYIMWKRNNSDVEEGVMVPVQESGNPTSVFSLLTATGEEYNNTIYTCMVKHTNMENPSTPKTASTEKSKFTVKVKPPQVKELFVNKTAELECVVTGDELEVKEAEILWTVGGTQADKINITTSPAKQKEKEFTKSSWLTLDESVWFKGSEVKCSTKQSKLSDTIKIKSGATNCSVQVHKPAEPVPDEVSVLCEVRCSPLGDVYIMWRKNEGPIEEGVIVPGPKNESPISVLSVLTVTREEYNTNTIFTCAVKHGGMKNADRPLQANTSKTDPDPKSGSCLYIDENCTLEEDEYNSLWSTASSFIFLFLVSLIYITILRLSKMK